MAARPEAFAQFVAAPPAEAAAVQGAEAELGVQLPQDYRDFLRKADGGEGFVGEHYLVLWKASELASFNRDYEVAEFAPGLIVFASNGGGEGFAFDTRSAPFPVVQVPFVGMDLDAAIPVANGFDHLLTRMVETEGSLF